MIYLNLYDVPNTSLEPTAVTRGSFRFDVGLADTFCRRGSVLGR
jgi:hypothetical protein